MVLIRIAGFLLIATAAVALYRGQPEGIPSWMLQGGIVGCGLLLLWTKGRSAGEQAAAAVDREAHRQA